MDITKLSKELQDVIISVYKLGIEDAGADNLLYSKSSDGMILRYIDDIISPKTQENAT